MGLYADRIFPACYDWLMGMGKLDRRRSGALKPVRGEILEIGIGTGRNLDHYPTPVDQLTGIDPNPGMLRQLAGRSRDHRIKVDCHRASADALPFADSSFDTVVSTHTLCSLPDRAGALAEIRRVLRPDGRLVFLEHGLSPDDAVAQWQRRLNGIQRRFAVGCLLDVPVEEEIQQAGFDFEHLHKGYQEGESRTHGYLYEGVACPAS
ncbi:MAG: methyltransferase domain-containing protein [Verrucomicrobiota bacterium]